MICPHRIKVNLDKSQSVFALILLCIGFLMFMLAVSSAISSGELHYEMNKLYRACYYSSSSQNYDCDIIRLKKNKTSLYELDRYTSYCTGAKCEEVKAANKSWHEWEQKCHNKLWGAFLNCSQISRSFYKYE